VLPHSLGRREAATLALQDAHADYAGAVVAHAEAKRALELAKAHRLVQGIEGKNAEQRDAILRLDWSAMLGGFLAQTEQLPLVLQPFILRELQC
jgi:hypothetical protein